MNNGELTAKQRRFCEEYLVDLNATQAAIRAGYSKDSASSIGGENLKKRIIRKYIYSLIEQRRLRTRVTADKVLEELAKIAFAKDGMKTGDKLKALDMLAKHVGLFDKQSLEFPELPNPNVKEKARPEATSEEERQALAIIDLLYPMDRYRVHKALEKWLEEQKHSKPTEAAENAPEEDGNSEEQEVGSDIIKIMKDVLGEEGIKRSMQMGLESLLSRIQ